MNIEQSQLDDIKRAIDVATQTYEADMIRVGNAASHDQMKTYLDNMQLQINRWRVLRMRLSA